MPADDRRSTPRISSASATSTRPWPTTTPSRSARIAGGDRGRRAGDPRLVRRAADHRRRHPRPGAARGRGERRAGQRPDRELIAAHLVRAEKRAGATWYELAHDRLIEPVRERQRRLAREASGRRAAAGRALGDAQGRPPGLLLAGAELRGRGSAGRRRSRVRAVTEVESAGSSPSRARRRRPPERSAGRRGGSGGWRLARRSSAYSRWSLVASPPGSGVRRKTKR